ncbi:MAG: M28 family peptidase [Bacteroidales bacterium]|nr:M28 family peptidase [Bacteroidales bacterium]
MKLNIGGLYMLVAIFLLQACKPVFNHQITETELKESVAFFASDSLKGRYPGTLEDSVLVSYILNKMDLSGMLALGDKGKQLVKAEHGFTVGDRSSIRLEDGTELRSSMNELIMYGFSANGSFSGEIVRATHLPENKASAPDSFMLMIPYPANVPEEEYDAYEFLRTTGLKAADAGFNALIFVYKQPVKELSVKKRLPLPIPVIAVSQDNAATILEKNPDISFEGILKEDSYKITTSGIVAHVTSEIIPNEIHTFNTISKLKGSDRKLSNEYVIIGAHHDHLGMGGRGSSSRRQDTVAVHYGADDNASGVAGLIELSQNLMNRSPNRSFIFTSFAAEEMGLLGSKTFVEDPVIDLANVQAMINLDMIGRLNNDRQLQIGGIGTAPVFRTLLDSVNLDYEFNIAYSEAGYGPSDHSSFYAKDIPVLFISTGAHIDYHTPFDTPDKINYAGMQEVLSFISDVAFTLSDMPGRLTFTEAGPKKASESRGREGMITFGLMPDVMYDGNEGMPVSFVTEGKPAAVGGMKAGDIIKAIDDKSVGNVYDYMERLSELEEGQSVIVTVDRDGENLDLLLKL